MKLIVECRSEPRRGEVPLRFGSEGRMHKVVEVLDCWEGEHHRDFRVRADDDSIYILRHDLPAHIWRIQFFQQGSEGRPA